MTVFVKAGAFGASDGVGGTLGLVAAGVEAAAGAVTIGFEGAAAGAAGFRDTAVAGVEVAGAGVAGRGAAGGGTGTERSSSQMVAHTPQV